jgi:hypothetical protein
VTLDIVTAHVGADCMKECVRSWGDPPPLIVVGKGMLEAYEEGWRSTQAEIIALIHDDVHIYEQNWRERVLREFADPTVGLVGFGGALQHGSDDLYKTPYNYKQLGRGLYLSNVADAEVHGQRFTGACDVSVLDGFCLIVRRSILERMCGWLGHGPIGYSLYDYLICCETHRQGFRIRVVGVKSHHLGGRSAVALKLAEGQGKAHEDAHKWLWEHYRDVLPYRCI